MPYLAGLAQLLERQHTDRRVSGSFPVKGTNLSCKLNQAHIWRYGIDVSPSLPPTFCEKQWEKCP